MDPEHTLFVVAQQLHPVPAVVRVAARLRNINRRFFDHAPAPWLSRSFGSDTKFSTCPSLARATVLFEMAHGTPVSRGNTLWALVRHGLGVLRLFPKEFISKEGWLLARLAATEGSLPILHFLHEQHSIWITRNDMQTAVLSGQVDVTEWIVSLQPVWLHEALFIAAQHSRMAVLSRLIEVYGSHDVVFSGAARNDSEHVIQCLLSHADDRLLDAMHVKTATDLGNHRVARIMADNLQRRGLLLYEFRSKPRNRFV